MDGRWDDGFTSLGKVASWLLSAPLATVSRLAQRLAERLADRSPEKFGSSHHEDVGVNVDIQRRRINSLKVNGRDEEQQED